MCAVINNRKHKLVKRNRKHSS